MRRIILGFAAALVAAPSLAADTLALPRYRLIDLGNQNHATALNNSGEVVGYYDGSTPWGVGVKSYWPNMLGPVTALAWTSATGWQPIAAGAQTQVVPAFVDDKGNIAGVVGRGGFDSYRAMWLPVNRAPILFPDATQNSFARSASKGLVVGTTNAYCPGGQQPPCDAQAAMAWSPGAKTWTAYPGPTWGFGGPYLGSSGTAIDASGRVYGAREYSYPLQWGPAWWESTLTVCSDGAQGTCAAPYIEYDDMLLGGNVEAVNGHLHAVGWGSFWSAVGTQSMFWDVSVPFPHSQTPLQMTGAGTASATEVRAFAINLHDQVVGQAWDPNRGTYSFGWTKSTGTVDLDKLDVGVKGWKFLGAFGINDNGWILTSGCPDTYCNDAHDVLLVPR